MLPFEEPKFDIPEISSSEGGEEKLVELNQGSKKDLEPDEVFEITEKEYKLKDKLECWVDEMASELWRRAENFGLGEMDINKISEDLKSSFKNSVDEAKDIDEIKKLQESSNEIIAKISDEKTKTKLQDLSNQLSEKSFLDLLDRKLQGEITSEEGDLLNVFSEAKEGGKLGLHNPLDKKIDIRLFNSKDFSKYEGVLAHEFTHKALSDLVPETKKEEMKISATKAFERGLGTEKSREEMTEKEKTQDLFFQNLLAIEESLAHRAGEYYSEEEVEPDYIAYSDKVHPGVFKNVYFSINTAVQGKSLAEFDQFSSHLYRFFSEKWHKNLSEEELQSAARSTIEEVEAFRGK